MDDVVFNDRVRGVPCGDESSCQPAEAAGVTVPDGDMTAALCPDDALSCGGLRIGKGDAVDDDVGIPLPGSLAQSHDLYILRLPPLGLGSQS